MLGIAASNDSTSANSYAGEESETRDEADKPKPAVVNSPWDGSVSQVEDWMDQNLHDPDPEIVEWFAVTPDAGGYHVRVQYRAENLLGANVLKDQVFFFDSIGNFQEVLETSTLRAVSEVEQ